MPDADPKHNNDARAAPGLLSYRAVRYLSFIGMAPKWIDWLLIIATAITLFFAMMGLVLCAMAEADQPRMVFGLISFLGWSGTFGLYWWSDHFRHKKPVSIDDTPLATPATPQATLAAVPVVPLATRAGPPPLPMAVIPVNAGDPAPSQSGPGPGPAAPVDPAS